jgi:hypothetical protein
MASFIRPGSALAPAATAPRISSQAARAWTSEPSWVVEASLVPEAEEAAAARAAARRRSGVLIFLWFCF